MAGGGKRDRVAAELRRDGDRTNAAVALVCRVSASTVAAVRRGLGLPRGATAHQRTRRRVEEELRRGPGGSDRAIAAACGCSPPTVASVRRGLGLEDVDRRGADGRLWRRRG